MIVIYTGPTLSPEKAKAILDAEYRPPIVRGDLSKLPRKTKIVGIIDGVFYSESAIAHKEIIEVMKKGITVVGSSSMGALRAAELTGFGMIGVGRVYECYRSGRITADDEVAVTFNPVTGEQIAEPLINVRYQLKAAETGGVIDRDQRQAIVELTGKLFYPQRTYPAIVSRAIEAGIITDAKGDQLLKFVAAEPLNLKAEDAVLLLEKIKSIAGR
ncbi:TfuA-related McrA-glycine thioamidation protein [Methanocella sp. MCL-LM]|uniref:TfuA-related McrA-glycine thioamidation protein n=1 Tax=Methanocella sp. MCL-LM TaxID=3412035 RepID=UPI003C717BCF